MLNHKQMQEIANQLQFSLIEERKSQQEQQQNTEELFNNLVPKDKYKHVDDMRSVDEETQRANWAQDEWTLLHFAAHLNYLELCEFLLSKGANLEAQDSSLKTPLSIAAKAASPETVELFVDRGAKINHPSKLDKKHKKGTATPLNHACGVGPDKAFTNNRLKVIEFLVNKGADVKTMVVRGLEWDEDSEPYHTNLHMLVSSAKKTEKAIDPDSKNNCAKAICTILDSIPEGEERDEFFYRRTYDQNPENKHLTASEWSRYFSSKCTGDASQHWYCIIMALGKYGKCHLANPLSDKINSFEAKLELIREDVRKVEGDIERNEKSAKKTSFKRFLEVLSISGPFCFISEMVSLGLKKPDFESNKNMYFAMCSSVMVLMVIGICCYFNDKYYDKNTTQITDTQTEAVSSPTKTSR